MNDFDRIDPPDSPSSTENIASPKNVENKKPKNRINGCLLVIVSSMVIFGFSVFVMIAIISYKILKESPNLVTSFSTTMDHVQETVIADGDAKEKIVIIQVSGIIYHGDGLYRENSSSRKIIDQLKKIQNDPDVVAVVLDMNTPGGSVTATDEIHHELQKVRKKGIKIVTCMRTIAASGGYYLAAGTDYIIANRLTLTGSIGVIMGGYNYHRLFEKIGVQSEIYKSGKHKDLLNMARSRNPEEIKVLQELIDETYHEFAKIVAVGRDLDLNEINNGPIGDAGIFSGRRAQELGLVDGLGYLEDAIKKAGQMVQAKRPMIVRYTLQYSIKELLFSSLGDWFLEVFPGKSALVKRGLLYYLCPSAL